MSDAADHYKPARPSAVLDVALGTGDDKLLTDFARNHASRLRWAQRRSPDDCADVLTGRSNGLEPATFADYHRRLIGRAILAGTPPPDRKSKAAEEHLFDIPPAIFNDAQRRSLSDRATFRRALRGEGSAQARCNARIALVDAAVLGGGLEGCTMLRDLFAVR